jgi:c-di-GMP-binding flagellar brake protein YcgR
LSYKNKLFPGAVIELKIPEGDYQGNYYTKVEEIREQTLYIGAPYHQGEIVPLRVGTVLEVLFNDQMSAYIFNSTIKQRTAVPTPVFVLDIPNEIRKIQRRSFVRVKTFLPLTYQVVTKEGLSQPQKGNALDLSGGGMCFETFNKLENNELLSLRLTLPSGELNIGARILRANKSEETKSYKISSEFHEISEHDRDLIIRYVFELQRTMRKKGLI